MRKCLLGLVIIGTASAPVLAHTAPAGPQVQPAKPLTVKKRVCEKLDNEDTGSRLGGRTVCRTIEVKVEAQQPTAQQSPAQPAQSSGR